MNYIKRIEQEKAGLMKRIEAMEEEISIFRAHLSSPKFVGTDVNGRKDWISTSDVYAYLENIRRAGE